MCQGGLLLPCYNGASFLHLDAPPPLSPFFLSCLSLSHCTCVLLQLSARDFPLLFCFVLIRFIFLLSGRRSVFYNCASLVVGNNSIHTAFCLDARFREVSIVVESHFRFPLLLVSLLSAGISLVMCVKLAAVCQLLSS